MNKFNLSFEDWASVGKGAGIAALGAVLAYLAQYLTTDAATNSMGPIVAATAAVLINYLRKVISNNGSVDDQPTK